MRSNILFILIPFIVSYFGAPVLADVPPVPVEKPEIKEVKKDDSDKKDLEEEKKTEAEPAPKAEKPKPEKNKNFTADHVGGLQTYKAEYEDTFIKIAREHNLGFVELQAANPNIDPWIPGDGVSLTLPTMHLLPQADRKGIIVNLPEMRLYYFENPKTEPVSFPIGIGREGLLTPTGITHVRAKKEGPTWRPTPRMRREDPSLPAVVPPGPENPLGTHILYFGWATYGIHGTDKPYGIGRRVSSGCIRMYPEDIVEFYPQVPTSTKVTVVNQPVKAAWVDDEFYVEAHPTMEQADEMEATGGLPSNYEISQDDMSIIIDVAGDSVDDLDWRLIREVVRQRSGIPVIVGERLSLEEKQDSESAEES